MTDQPQTYLIGQRVILNGTEIGVVHRPENRHGLPGWVWVLSPSRGYPSCYDPASVKPLPNGQL